MDAHNQFRKDIAAKEKRRLKSLRNPEPQVWFGLGTFGMVGWSVAIPTVLGIALGIWIDKTFMSRYSWTLILLTLGIMAGCCTAGVWIARERKDIHEQHGDGQ